MKQNYLIKGLAGGRNLTRPCPSYLKTEKPLRIQQIIFKDI